MDYVFITSNYFNNTSVSQENLTDFAIEKKIKINTVMVDKKTICYMLRNINLLTSYEHQKEITQLIHYIHSAVAILKSHKYSWDKYMGYARGNHIKERSQFDDQKKEEALLLLEHPHEIFLMFKELYHKCQGDDVKNRLLECVYYTNQINKKLLFYEQDSSSTV